MKLSFQNNQFKFSRTGGCPRSAAAARLETMHGNYSILGPAGANPGTMHGNYSMLAGPFRPLWPVGPKVPKTSNFSLELLEFLMKPLKIHGFL